MGASEGLRDLRAQISFFPVWVLGWLVLVLVGRVQY